MRLAKVIITRMVPVVLVAGLFVAVPAGPASAGTRTPRICVSYYAGNWKLDVCSGGYYRDSTRARAVVDMHTYRWASPCPSSASAASGRVGVAAGCWVDSRSQSITMNVSIVEADDQNQSWFFWGQNHGAQCRENDPEAGTVRCSVPNAVRVSFYSTLFSRNHWHLNTVYEASWRDASGQPHYVSKPTGGIVSSPWF